MTLPATPSMPLPAPPSFPEIYERELVGPLFAPWAEQLLDRVPLSGASRVLDIACGTGIVARLARERMRFRGHVTAVDRVPAMLAVARALEPAIDWREGDAAALPLEPHERFDAALCHQGLQFFADRPAAARAMRRALVPGGRAGVAVWRAIEENGLFHDLNEVATRFVGPIPDLRHAFPDAGALARLLLDAGFEDVSVEPVTMETRFTCEPESLARLNTAAVTGMTAKGKAMSEAERAEVVQRIVDASVDEVARHVRDGAIVFPTSANLATARA